MKKILLILIICYFWGCSKDNSNSNVCNSDNPFEMEWFSEWIADLQYCSCTISIFQAEYEGETVFWELMTDPLCQGIIKDVSVYCCTGCEFLILADYDDLIEFQKKVSNMKIVYNCSSPKK